MGGKRGTSRGTGRAGGGLGRAGGGLDGPENARMGGGPPVTTRRRRWTDALIGPLRVAPEPEGLGSLQSRVCTELADAAAGQPPWRELVVTLRTLRLDPKQQGGPDGFDQPFRWRPAFVRRSLGLAALDACLRGRFRDPAEAVGPVAEEAVRSWQRSGWRTYHWEPWFSYLPPGGRAAVLAEAIRWATSLWCAFEWDDLVPLLPLGGPDLHWRCP